MRFLKSFLKRPIYLAVLVICYVVDFFRYSLNASVVFLSDSDRKLGYLIRKDNHRIEKGLALPQPRVWFGDPVLARLISNIQSYMNLGKVDQRLIDETAAVLTSYKSFFESKQLPPKNIQEKLDELSRLIDSKNVFKAGIVALNRQDIDEAIDIDFAKFFNSRFSVRQFSGAIISDDVVESSVLLATKTPSVCNRCAWKVYNIRTPDLLKKVLGCQNGNAGFGDSSGNVIVVAMDLRAFEGPGERNQAYVDGGLFAMSLSLALHSNNVASCFLNWSAHVFQDQKLRSVLNIPSHEVVVTLMAIGEYKDDISVAISPRPQVSDILTTI